MVAFWSNIWWIVLGGALAWAVYWLLDRMIWRGHHAGTRQGYGSFSLAGLLTLLALLWWLWMSNLGPNLAGWQPVAPAVTVGQQTLTPAVPAPLLPAAVEFRSSQSGLQLTGRVDSAATKAALGTAAETAYGKGNVINDLNADIGFAAPSWAAKAGELAVALKAAGPDKVLVASGSSMLLAGIAASDSAKATAAVALRSLLGKDITLEDRVAVVVPQPPPPPAPKLPAAVEFRTAEAGLQLTGRIDSDATKAALNTAAVAAFGAGKVTSDLKVDAGSAVPAWIGKSDELLVALKRAGPGKVLVAAGDHAMLAGLASTGAEKDTAASALATLLGKDVSFDNRVAVLPPPPPPPPPKVPASVVFETSDAGLQLTGRVDSEASKAAISLSAEAAFGAGKVKNELTADSGIAAPVWIAKSTELFTAFRAAGNGMALAATGNNLSLSGVAANDVEKAVAGNLLKSLLGKDIGFENRVAVLPPPPPPLPKVPASIVVETTDTGLRLTGRVDSEASKSAIAKAAEAAFGAGRVANDLTADGGVAAPAWSARALDLFTALKAAGPGKVLAATGDKVVLTGHAANEAERAASETALTALLGKQVALDDRVAVLPTPPPPPPPPEKVPASVAFNTSDGGLHLTGRVDSEATKAAIAAAAKAVFGAGKVVNDLTADGGVAAPVWSARTAEFLNVLHSAGPGKVLVATGDNASLAGVAANDTEKAASAKALSTLLGRAATLDARLVVLPPAPPPPQKVPASVQFSTSDAGLHLAGRVDSDATKATLTAAALTTFGASMVTSDLTADAGVATPTWKAKAADLLAALKAAGPGKVLVATGDNALLAGTAANEVEKVASERALSTLLGRGVRLDNRVALLPPPPPPPPPKVPASVEFRTSSDGLHLAGRVDSETTRAALVKAADAVYGAGKVTTTLVADSTVAVPRWNANAANLIAALKAAGPGKLLVATGDNVILAGVAANDAEKAASQKALATLLGKDVTVDDRVAVLPVPPPPAPAPVAPPAPVVATLAPSVELHSSADGVKLLGRVDTDATRTAIGSAAEAVFGTGKVANELAVEPGTAPIGWQSHAIDIMGQLKSWGSASVLRTDGNKVTLAGTAPSEADRQARANAVRRAIGLEVQIDNRIAVSAMPQEIIKIVTPALSCADLLKGLQISFDSGSSRLDATGKRLLDGVIACLTARSYQVVGYTDSVGTADFNDYLSLRRAERVAEYLRTRGVTSELKTAGGSSDNAVADNTSEQGRAQNRRIEFKPL